jgi:hypothetical protein
MSKSATADLDAQARNPYSRRWLWIPGSRFARPGMTVYYLDLHDFKIEQRQAARSGTNLRSRELRRINWPVTGGAFMGRYLLLWLIGVPLPILVLIYAFGGLH